MKKASKLFQLFLGIMPFFNVVLLTAGIAFCIAAFCGHTTAYSASAVCFCAVSVITMQKK